MSQAQSLQKKLRKGGLIDLPAASREEAVNTARQAGMTAFVVDCDRARSRSAVLRAVVKAVDFPEYFGGNLDRSEEHTSELQSLMRISYAVFCLKKKKNTTIAATVTYILTTTS